MTISARTDHGPRRPFLITGRKLLWSAGVVAVAATVTAVPTSPATGAATCPSTVSVPAQVMARYYPPLVAGDAEFEGHGPAITVSAIRKLWSASTDYLTVDVTMRAKETKSDWTTAQGTRASLTLYRAPTGCHIVASSVPYGNFDSNGYLATSSLANPYSLPAGNSDVVNRSFVLGYTVWDDHVGNDVGSYTSVQVSSRAFQLRLTS